VTAIGCGFNRADANAIAEFYSEDATKHQIVRDPIVGRDAIREVFAGEFAQATMVCQIEKTFQHDPRDGLSKVE
jgi:ketosteroid isomerase-like protein